MIRSIEIKGLRGIREGKLDDLTPLVVLVGPNGSGKSTVLDALLIGASPNVGVALTESVLRSAGLVRAPRWLHWKGEGGSQSETIVHSRRMCRRCRLSLSHDARGPHGEFNCKVLIDTGTERRSARGSIGFSGGLGWSGSVPDFPVEDIPSVRITAAHPAHRFRALYELFSAAVEQGRQESANAIIAAVVPGVSNVAILAEGEKPVLHLVYPDRSVPADLAGDGVHALLRICLELASRPGGIVLMEEPEVHQHPGAIRQTAKAILAAVRRDIQVVLTTHSLELIDALLAEATDEDLDKLSLYRTQLDDGVLKSHRLPGPDVAFARTEIEDDLR